MLKYWKILMLLVIVLGAILSIGLKAYPYGRSGVEIVYIADNSPAKDILSPGMIITELNKQGLQSPEDWEQKISVLSGQISLMANGKTYNFLVNDSLGIDVTSISRTNLEFGLDLKGGTRIILRPTENATAETVIQAISTLQTRANIYGLREIEFTSIRDSSGGYYIQIEAAGIGRDIIDSLLSRQGKFEAKIVKPVDIQNNQGNLRLGLTDFPVTASNMSVRIDNREVAPNQTFVLRDITFQYLNRTGNRLLFVGTAYETDDIELVYTDPQRSAIIPQNGGYLFYFTVLVSQDGAKRFADITSGLSKFVDINTGEEYLDSSIQLYLDGNLVSELRIGSSLAGQIYTTPQIQGSRPTIEEASQERLALQTILRSGALPVTLETASVDVISPTLGSGFFTSAIVAGLIAGIVVFLIIFIRYRSLKVGLPIVFVSVCEILIVIGIAAANDTYIWLTVLLINIIIVSIAWIKKHSIDIFSWTGAILIPLLGMVSWTIDLPTIGGIIAAIGTGVNDQIILADETVVRRQERHAIRDQIKKAFFIIFGAAATVIAAMFPLMFLGVGLVRGFAITTIIGVLVGILITRPAYSVLLERIREKQAMKME